MARKKKIARVGWRETRRDPRIEETRRDSIGNQMAMCQTALLLQEVFDFPAEANHVRRLPDYHLLNPARNMVERQQRRRRDAVPAVHDAVNGDHIRRGRRDRGKCVFAFRALAVHDVGRDLTQFPDNKACLKGFSRAAPARCHTRSPAQHGADAHAAATSTRERFVPAAHGTRDPTVPDQNIHNERAVGCGRSVTVGGEGALTGLAPGSLDIRMSSRVSAKKRMLSGTCELYAPNTSV